MQKIKAIVTGVGMISVGLFALKSEDSSRHIETRSKRRIAGALLVIIGVIILGWGLVS